MNDFYFFRVKFQKNIVNKKCGNIFSGSYMTKNILLKLHKKKKYSQLSFGVWPTNFCFAILFCTFLLALAQTEIHRMPRSYFVL